MPAGGSATRPLPSGQGEGATRRPTTAPTSQPEQVAADTASTRGTAGARTRDTGHGDVAVADHSVATRPRRARSAARHRMRAGERCQLQTPPTSATAAPSAAPASEPVVEIIDQLARPSAWRRRDGEDRSGRDGVLAGRPHEYSRRIPWWRAGGQRRRCRRSPSAPGVDQAVGSVVLRQERTGRRRGRWSTPGGIDLPAPAGRRARARPASQPSPRHSIPPRATDPVVERGGHPKVWLARSTAAS